MNKWGTHFADPVLERNYEMKQRTTIRYPLFVLLSFTGALFMIISMSVQLEQNNIERAITYAGLFVFTVIQAYFIQRHTLLVNYGLFTMSVIYISICFTIAIPRVLATVILESYILITAHSMIFSVQNLSFGIAQLIINSNIISCYNSLNVNYASVHVTIGYFWINGVVIFCTYRSQQLNRQFYLLSQKDKKLHMLLDKVVSKKVLIFDFDQEQFKFRKIYSHKFDLKKLLDCRKGSQTMSEYLFNRLKSYKCQVNEFFSEDFMLKDNDRLIKVSLSEFYYEQKTFMVILNEVEQMETMKIATNKIRLYLTKNIRLLSELLKTNQDTKIIQCRMIFMQLIAFKQSSYEQCKIFSQINLSRLIKVYWKLIQLGYKKNKFYLEQDKIHHITSIESLLSLVLIEVLFQFRNHSQSTCQINQIDNFIQILVTTNEIFHPRPSRYRNIALKTILSQYNAIRNGMFNCIFRVLNNNLDKP